MNNAKFRVWENGWENSKYLLHCDGAAAELNGFSCPIFSLLKPIFEFYTGLKDANGVEIYGGDVLQYGDDKDFRFTVIFKYGCFYAHNILGESFIADTLLGSLVMSGKVNVIGNIHERPGLLA